MDEAISTDAGTEIRREDLSPTLLRHAGAGQPFLGFISYRRRDALPLARWLRDRITGFVAPPELKARIDARDATVGGARNRVFLDLSYQKPNVDFWDEHIGASLCRSGTMILLQTPSIFERLDDGEPDWCEREIETFLRFSGDASRVLVVMGPGAPIDRFPAPLERISARWDWIDLRFFSESALSRFRYGSQYDPQVAKVLAKIFDIEDGDLPILNREFAKARANIRRNLAVAAGATMIGLSGLTVWALVERQRATVAEHVAMQERDEAIRQRNAALVSQSRYLAKAADGLVEAGTTRGAVAVLREALPDKAAGRDRPLVNDVIVSAYNAIFANRERGRLEMPEGAAAVATDGSAGRIVVATADKLYVRQGLTTEGQRILPHDFGAPKKLVLSPDGETVAMIAGDGAVALRDLRDNRLVLRHPGAGAGTRVAFVKGGRLLLVADAGWKDLRLVDAADGREIASRRLTNTNGKPIVTLIQADADLLAVVSDEQLIRLSLDDLSELARFQIDDADEYALALSPDKSLIYLAAAGAILQGRLMALDSATLALKRSFGKIAWGAKGMSISKRWNMLALHGQHGIDFYDLQTGDRIYHVMTGFSVVGGQFLGESTDSDYMAYGSDGSIRRWTPDLGVETAAYMTVDGGAIQSLDRLKDGSGFLSISDRPSITNWAFDEHSVSREFSLPAIINNINLHMLMPMRAFDESSARDEATAAYTGNAVYRWNLNSGARQNVRREDPHGEVFDHVVGLQGGVSVLGRPSGELLVYSDAGGADAPLAAIKAAPLAYLGEIAASQAFFVTKDGAAGRLNLASPAQPAIEMLPALGLCGGEVAIDGFAVCIGAADRRLRVLRNSDGKLLADWPAPAEGMSAAGISDDGSLMAIADRGGRIVLRALSDGAVEATLDTKARLSGAALATAAKRGLLSEAQAASAREGATTLELALPARSLEISPDKSRLAASLPNGIVRLFDLKAGGSRDLEAAKGDVTVDEMRFSAHGRDLAIITASDYRLLSIYEVESGKRLARIGLSTQVKPKLYALNNGHGFLTIDTSGRILTHPVFEQPEDFIAYLAQQFRDKLTPAQRRFFFID